MKPSLGKRKVQHRFRHRRRLKMLLLCLGLGGTVLGLMFLGVAIFSRFEGPKFFRFGVLYLVSSLGLLGIRVALTVWDDLRKRKYASPIDLKPATHLMRPAPAPVIENPEEQEEQQGGPEAAPGGAR